MKVLKYKKFFEGAHEFYTILNYLKDNYKNEILEEDGISINSYKKIFDSTFKFKYNDEEYMLYIDGSFDYDVYEEGDDIQSEYIKEINDLEIDIKEFSINDGDEDVFKYLNSRESENIEYKGIVEEITYYLLEDEIKSRID